MQQTGPVEKAAGRGRRVAGRGRGDWRRMNEQCTIGPAGCRSRTACAYRPLPLDAVAPGGRASSSCRLSDDYMLESNRTAYLRLQTELLAARAGQYAAACKDGHDAASAACERTSLEMLRAVGFISKAWGKAALRSLTEEERAQQARMLGSAVASLSEAVGPDGASVLELNRKLVRDEVGARQDPRGTVTKIVSLTARLLRGSEAEKRAAREAIAAMPEPPQPRASRAPGSPDVGLSELEDRLEEHADEVRHLVDRVNGLDRLDARDRPQVGGSGGRRSGAQRHADGIDDFTAEEWIMHFALLEESRLEGSNPMITKVIISTIIIVVNVIMCVVATLRTLAFLAVWALVAVLGCGVSAVSAPAALPRDWATHAEQSLRCAGDILARPFTLVGQAANSLCRLFGGCPQGPLPWVEPMSTAERAGAATNSTRPTEG